MNDEFEYDVALSFAGEDRVYVEEVVSILKKKTLNVFYDQFEDVKLWGKDLYEYLDDVYRKKARYCIIFISKHYATKAWPTHERRSAQARAFASNEEYILPARFDDTEIPGVRPTVGYIDLRELSAGQFAEKVIEKVSGSTKRREATSNNRDWIKVQTFFRPISRDRLIAFPLSDIEKTAKESMLRIVTPGYEQGVSFPLPLSGGFLQKTTNEILYRIEPATLSTNYHYQDSLSLQSEGSFQSVQVYRWHQDQKTLLELEKVVFQLVHSLLFAHRWMSRIFPVSWALRPYVGLKAHVRLSASIPMGTLLFDQRGLADTKMEIAHFSLDTQDVQGEGDLLIFGDDLSTKISRLVERILNFVVNNFEYSSFGKRGFARINAQVVMDYVHSAFSRLRT